MAKSYTHEFDTPMFKGKVTVPTGLFINNKWVDPIEKSEIEVIDPTTGKVITHVAGASARDVDLAVAAAKEAYAKSWGTRTPGVERGRLLNKLADLIAEHIDEISALETLDCGKFFPHAKMMDVTFAITAIRYYAGWADKMSGKTIEADETKFVYTIHEPVGVVGCIVPWNFPMLINSWKLGPALATGNTVVLKPSEVTPLSTLFLGKLIEQAGFPPGVVNIIPGYGSVAGQAITEHPDVRKVSFTGSTLTGRRVMETAAKSNLKRVTLELGGKSPSIVFDDADLEQAVKWSSLGIFHHSGQMCAAGSRIFVQAGIYDKFVEALTQAAQAAKGGSGFDPQTTSGPVVSQTQFDRVMGYIKGGKDAGAKIITGGGRIGNAGYYVQPTIFTGVKPDMKIVREEIFGPVGVLVKFNTEEEVLKMANDTSYGLASAVFTTNLNRATEFARKIEAGSVFINVAPLPDFRVPFGGFKQSGFGKDLGEYALEAYTNVKAVHVNTGHRL